MTRGKKKEHQRYLNFSADLYPEASVADRENHLQHSGDKKCRHEGRRHLCVPDLRPADRQRKSGCSKRYATMYVLHFNPFRPPFPPHLVSSAVVGVSAFTIDFGWTFHFSLCDPFCSSVWCIALLSKWWWSMFSSSSPLHPPPVFFFFLGGGETYSFTEAGFSVS